MYNHISYVLENNLVISRFMFDHAIILLALISYNDNELRKIYEKEKENYGKILLNTISNSYNKVSPKFLNSDILITNYTDLMAGKTCKLFKIEENTEIYLKSLDLIENSKAPIGIFAPEEYLEIKKNNLILLEHLKDSLKSLKKLSKEITDGMATLFFTENLINHLIEETEIHVYTLDFLDKQMTFTPTYVYKCKYYYNLFLKTHAGYLKDMIFPVNLKYCDEADIYINDFDKIIKEFDNDISPKSIEILNNETKEATEKFIGYNTELIQNIISSKYYAAAIPLLNEHILRESNYVTYQLDLFKSIL